ncbi:MAG: hypothetical protein JO166_24915, partial [Deltaproteobacteria bacterium]|nr:hypothetical protein [Deltaproteobacteria bacterium]
TTHKPELETNGAVELGDYYAGQTNLKCPRCGWDFLHLRRITVYDRGEDAEMTSVTTACDGLSATHLLPSREVANPSARRDGMAILFECEACSVDLYRSSPVIELTIAQHKGITLLGWRFEPLTPQETDKR